MRPIRQIPWTGVLAASLTLLAILAVSARPAFAGQATTAPAGGQNAGQTQTAEDYVIGPEDTLGILFWRDEAMSTDVTVRPDGKISLPLLNDVVAAGLTPDQLRARLLELAKKFVEEPNVTVIVRQINSKKVFITGQVTRPGVYQLTAPTTVLQLIALAGGLTDFANEKEIVIVRPGTAAPLRFNYQQVREGRNPAQNIQLRVGDTVVVSY